MNDGAYDVLPYTFDDLVATLNGVQPFDWASFLREILDRKEPGAPLGGLTRGGWKLAYADTPSEYMKARLDMRKNLDLTASVGLTVANDGTISDVLWDGPAYRAGVAPGMHLVAVDGREYTPQVLKDAITAAKITAAKSRQEPIALLVKDGDRYETDEVDYHDGLRFPVLERVEGTPDRLGEIVTARQ